MPHKPEDQDDSANKPSATARALQLLGQRARSAAELRRALVAEGYAEGEQDAALAATRGWGYVNDARLADALAHSAQRRGRGRRWLQQKLAGRGLPGAEAERVARAHQSCEPGLIAELLDRRFASRGLLHTPKGAQRAVRFLLGRGFGAAEVAAAVRRAARRDGEGSLALGALEAAPDGSEAP